MKETMNSFERKVYSFIEKERMLEGKTTVVVGFSGGADSTALIATLFELKDLLKIRIKAVHVNHCIRQEAGEDEAFVRDFCQKHRIDLLVESRDIPGLAKEWGMTEEEAGRKARYEAFEKAREGDKAAVIAVAHHKDDVAETLLMNLARGTGLHGAGGIRPVREKVIRPLLCVSRQEIEEYLREKSQSFCTDKTNAENVHTRNKIRNVVLPYLKDEINEAAAEHLMEAAQSFSRADEYIGMQARRLFDEQVSVRKGEGVAFNVNAVTKEPHIIKEYFIINCFETLVPGRKDISRAHVEAVVDMLSSCRGSASLDLPYGLMAQRSYEKLDLFFKREDKSSKVFEGVDIIKALKESSTQKININLPGLGVAEIEILEYNVETKYPTASYTKWLDYDRIQAAVFRTRQAEDVITLDKEGKFYTKKLSKYMTDEKIPVAVRDEMVVLADKNRIIWVPGYRIGSDFKVSEKTKNILVFNIINGGNNNG